MADTRAPGFLVPSVPGPADDDALLDFLQPMLAAVGGYDDTSLVRPRWQPDDTPNQPDQDVNWCALGVKNTRPDTYQFERHVDEDLGYNVFEYSEEVDLLVSCYGPLSQANARQIRQGFAIEQNRAYLEKNNIDTIAVGAPLTLPALLHGKWQRRVDLTIVLRRYVQSRYDIRTILKVNGPSFLDNELYRETLLVTDIPLGPVPPPPPVPGDAVAIEAANATDARSATMVAEQAVTEARTAQETVSAVRTVVPVVTEAAAASDAVTASLDSQSAITEQANAADLLVALLGVSRAQVELAAAGDVVWVADTAVGVTESANAVDGSYGIRSASGSLTESAAAADAPSATAAYFASAVEGGAATSAQDGTVAAPVTYSTLNPSDKSSNITLSNGNLTATGGSGSSQADYVRSTVSKTSGKWYWEATTNPASAGNSSGWADAALTLTAGSIPSTGNPHALLVRIPQQTYADASTSGFTGTWTGSTSNTVLGFALDAAARTLKVYQNGTLVITSTIPGAGAIYAHAAVDVGKVCTLNFGASAFVNAPPSGYNAGLYA